MLGKENYPKDFYSNDLEIKSPLKNFPLNTFNFIFSSQKKNQSNKKYPLTLSKKKIEKPKIEENSHIEFSNNDLLDIFEELNKKENLNVNKSSLSLLSKKRKRKFITINSQNNKKNFIK